MEDKVVVRLDYQGNWEEEGLWDIGLEDRQVMLIEVVCQSEVDPLDKGLQKVNDAREVDSRIVYLEVGTDHVPVLVLQDTF